MPADVSLENVWKQYHRGLTRGAEPFWAIRDVALEVPQGSSLGVIGRNGAERARCSSCWQASPRRPGVGSSFTDGWQRSSRWARDSIRS